MNTIESQKEDLNLNIDVVEAQKKLADLGERLAHEIQSLKGISENSVIISALFDETETFTMDNFKSNIERIVKEIHDEIESDNEGLSTAEGMQKIKLILSTLLMLPPASVTTEEAVRVIDSALCDIANDESIPLTTKAKFFNKMKLIADTRFEKRITRNVSQSGAMNPEDILPIKASYILNAQDCIERRIRLKQIKSLIKEETSSELATLQDPSAEILDNFGDLIIDVEAEDYYREETYNKAKADMNDSSVPLNLKEGNPDELLEILSLKSGEISIKKLALAKIQLLRIYREYLNLVLAGEKSAEVVILEENREIDLENPLVLKKNDELRLGANDSQEKSNARRKATRRLAVFNSLHIGTVGADVLNPKLDKGNQLPVSQEIIDFSKAENGSINVENVYGELTPEQQRRFTRIKPHLNRRIYQKKPKEMAENSIDAIDLPRKIISKALINLGIGSTAEETAVQIENAENKIPKNEVTTKKYGVHVKGSANVAIDHTYRLFVIPETINRQIIEIMAMAAHEFGHIYQQIARDGSILPGLNKMSGFGRAGILAESGAIKSEAVMSKLFNKKRDINTYHFEIIRMLIEGKNYWEVFNQVFGMLKKQSDESKDGKSFADLAKTTIRGINRAYNNLGSMGKESGEGRYPTNAEFLSYTYQAMDEFSKQPFYVSGIPAHRTDLKNFLSTPMLDGKPITEAAISGAIIDSTYETLLEAGIISEKET